MTGVKSQRNLIHPSTLIRPTSDAFAILHYVSEPTCLQYLMQSTSSSLAAKAPRLILLTIVRQNNENAKALWGWNYDCFIRRQILFACV
jgi:hypothetical protein